MIYSIKYISSNISLHISANNSIIIFNILSYVPSNITERCYVKANIPCHIMFMANVLNSLKHIKKSIHHKMGYYCFPYLLQYFTYDTPYTPDILPQLYAFLLHGIFLHKIKNGYVEQIIQKDGSFNPQNNAEIFTTEVTALKYYERYLKQKSNNNLSIEATIFDQLHHDHDGLFHASILRMLTIHNKGNSSCDYGVLAAQVIIENSSSYSLYNMWNNVPNLVVKELCYSLIRCDDGTEKKAKYKQKYRKMLKIVYKSPNSFISGRESTDMMIQHGLYYLYLAYYYLNHTHGKMKYYRAIKYFKKGIKRFMSCDKYHVDLEDAYWFLTRLYLITRNSNKYKQLLPQCMDFCLKTGRLQHCQNYQRELNDLPRHNSSISSQAVANLKIVTQAEFSFCKKR
eukprot:435264_1